MLPSGKGIAAIYHTPVIVNQSGRILLLQQLVIHSVGS